MVIRRSCKNCYRTFSDYGNNSKYCSKWCGKAYREKYKNRIKFFKNIFKKDNVFYKIFGLLFCINKWVFLSKGREIH